MNIWDDANLTEVEKSCLNNKEPEQNDIMRSTKSGSTKNKCKDIGIKNHPLAKTKEEFIFSAKLRHPDKYDYSKVDYINSHTSITITCPIHGDFSQKPYSHLDGKGCKKCYHCSRKLPNGEYIIRFKKVHGNEYDYSKVVFRGINKKVEITCKHCGNEFKQTPWNHYVGNGCPKCSCRISKPEEEFLDYLNIDQKHRQIRIKPYYVDALLGNTIYEFLGDYWHGNPEVYNENDINIFSKKTFRNLHTITQTKLKNLSEEGYKIKYIWEADWKKFKSGADKLPKIQTY